MERERIGPAAGVRIAGAGMVAVGLALAAVALASAWPFVLLGAAAVAFGVRKLRVAAVADDDGLVVRNALRSHRLPWNEIVEMGYHERDVSAKQWALASRRAGFIFTRHGRRVWIDATESSSIVLNGTHLSDPGLSGPAKLERLRRRWLRATGSPASTP